MKKLASILVALILVAATAVTAFAAGINENEQKVLDALSQTVSMKDGTKALPAEYINQAENYFNTIDLTADEATAIVEQINAGKSFLESANVSNITDLSYEQKTQLLSYAQAAAGVVGLTVSYDKTTKTAFVNAADGTVVFSAAPTLVAAGGSSTGGSTSGSTSGSTGVIKTTGAEANLFGFVALGAVALVLVAGSTVYLVKTKKREAIA